MVWQTLCVVGGAALLTALAGTVITLILYRTLLRPGYFLVVSAAGAVAVFTLTTAWLILRDKATSHSDDIRTGGIAAAAVLALYGLWLNDRRRRADEDRNRTEHDRFEQERARNAGEHFARAVELLGNPAEAVRLGALHSLAALGRGWPELAQPVLDVYCAYLRMPSQPGRGDPNGDRLRQVRLTAQRLIQELLSHGAPPDIGRRLDLSGASLRDFALTGVAVRTLLATGATCAGRTTFDGLRVADDCDLSGARFDGPFTAKGAALGTLTVGATCWTEPADLSNVTIDASVGVGPVSFERGVCMANLVCQGRFSWQIRCTGRADWTQATFAGGLDIANSQFVGHATFANAILAEGTNMDRVRFAEVNLRAMGLPAEFNPMLLEATATRDHILLPEAGQLKHEQINGDPMHWYIVRR